MFVFDCLCVCVSLSLLGFFGQCHSSGWQPNNQLPSKLTNALEVALLLQEGGCLHACPVITLECVVARASQQFQLMGRPHPFENWQWEIQ